MTSYVENETQIRFPFDEKALLDRIMDAVTEEERCPYETTVNVLITDNEGIRAYNRDYRQIDKETDVLSFPNLAFRRAGDFSPAEEDVAGKILDRRSASRLDASIPTAGNCFWAT